MTRWRACATNGCPTVITVGSSYCTACRRDRDRQRPSAAARGYGRTTGWPEIRRRYLATHPMCEEPGCSSPASHVDHIRGFGPFGPNDDADLQALCPPCHGRKTARHDGGFGHAEETPGTDCDFRLGGDRRGAGFMGLRVGGGR